MGKWFLNKRKTENNSIFFFDFILLIKEKLEILNESHNMFTKNKITIIFMCCIIIFKYNKPKY